MSCRLQSRITAILLLATTLPLCLTTHGSVLDQTQSVQVGRSLQKGSKPKGGLQKERTEQQLSNTASTETQRRWSSPARHSVLNETNNSKLYKSSSAFHQSNNTYMLTPRQGGTDAKELFQSDSPGFDVQGKVNLSSSHITEEWLQMRPLVRCSQVALILTAKGWNYVHLLVDRVGASPVSILHLPTHCGYNVKATWRNLVLIAPYDGCYVLQQNGSYVLPLLWWGMPVSISCPMTHSSAPATPSGFCSYLGITLKIEGSQGGIGKYRIKVNEEWVPLVSSTCAYRMDSAPEDLILFIPFTVKCAKDEGSTLYVLLDGKMYTLTCQPHHYLPHHPQYNPSAPFSQPLHPLHTQIIPFDPTLTKPEMSKSHLVPETTMEQPQHHILLPSEQTTPVGATGVTVQHPQHPSLLSYDMAQVPILHSSEIPTTRSTKITIPPFQSPFGHLPIVYPPYQYFPHHVYPHYHIYHQKPMPPDSHITEYKSALKQSLKPQTITVQESQMGLWPQMPEPSQVPPMHQLPQSPPMHQLPQSPPMHHLPQSPPMHQLPQSPQVPQVHQLPQSPQVPQVHQLPQSPQVPQVHQLPQSPQVHQLPQVPQVPQVHQLPQVPQVPQVHQLPQVPQVPQVHQLPQVPQVPQVHQLPQVPQVPQVHQLPQVPQKPHHRFPVLANDSSQSSPVLTCKGDRLRASLPSAKINSIKIKDVKRKVWVPVSSAPAHCGYSLQRKGRGVVFSSPLPACHTYTMSPSLLSLSLKFWDPAIPRHHAVRLQCPYTSPSPTITASSATTASLMPKPIFTRSQPARHEIRPSRPPKPLGSYSKPSKPRDSPIHFQKPIVPTLYPPKPTAPSFQQSKVTKPISWPHQPQVLCHSKDMSVTLPPGPITGLKVQTPTVGIKGSVKAVLLDEAPSHCGYLIKKNQNGGINVLLPYTSCHMAHQDGQYRIVLKYRTADSRRVEALLSCQVPMNHECSLPFEQRLACGPSSVSEAGCRELGCCYSPDAQTCYYAMDECTADRHFVFSIPASLTEPPLSPALLVAAGNSSCTPQRVVADLALFKIPLDGCGAHKYEVGNTVIYMLEILNTLNSVTLNYGTITRDSPFRLLVECRYLSGTVASVGYLVKSPSLGPSIQAQGVFGVQLRIAKDQQYSSYYPQYHRPLRKLLGKPLYLEVRLLNPLDPSAVLLVHYCVAYPRSAHSAWVLIYDGCPNPLDVTPSHEPPPTPPEGLANHVRRFTVSTFQFLENSRKETAPGEEEVVEKEGEEEEIYFMCATEVCLPSEGPCVEGCIDPVDSPAVKS